MRQEAVVIKHQRQVSVYPNGAGGVTIEMEGHEYEDAQLVFFDVAHANDIASAIIEAAKEIRGE